jgi:hypothetical protein
MQPDDLNAKQMLEMLDIEPNSKTEGSVLAFRAAVATYVSTFDLWAYQKMLTLDGPIIVGLSGGVAEVVAVRPQSQN